MKRILILISLLILSIASFISYSKEKTANLKPIKSSAVNSNKTYLGWMPVQYVSSGQEFTIDMRRFFEPYGKSTLEFGSTSDCKVEFDTENMQLKINVSPSKSGLIDVPVKIIDENNKVSGTSEITLILIKKTEHIFKYKPDKPVKKAMVAGSFNGWNSNKNEMTDEDGDGVYQTSIWLDPGTYQYKLVVDGNWIADPGNPEKEKGGYGNSLLTIKGSVKGQPAFIYPSKRTDKSFEISVINGSEPVDNISVAIEKPGGLTSQGKFKFENDKIIIENNNIPERSWVRIIVSDKNGLASNTVRFNTDNSGAFKWQDGIIYFTFTDRFSNGSKANDNPVKNKNLLYPANYHGGDFAGIINKIKKGYFEKLGINVIWLSPLNKNPDEAYKEYLEPHRYYTGYHGYWPVSPTELEPRFGTADEFKSLVNEAHKRDIKVIADIVLNHVHDSHPFWIKHRDWFGKLKLPDGTLNLRRWDEYAFTTWFEPFLPSFDFSNNEASDALIKNAEWWIKEFGLDGFRLDAVKHIPPAFWYKFRSYLRKVVEKDVHKHLYLVGETFMSREGIMSFVGPNMLDGQFDFPLYDTIKEVFAIGSSSFGNLDTSLRSSERVYGKESLMSPLIGNHDKSRFMAYADGDIPDPEESDEEEVGWKNPPKVDNPVNYKKIKLAMSFLMFLDGLPMIYYGDEFGMSGAGDPDNRRDMRFNDNLSSDEKDVLKYFSKVTHIRRNHPALRYGSRRSILVEKDRYAFIKSYFDDRLLLIINRQDKESKLELNVSPEFEDGEYQDLLTGKKLKVENGNLNILLVPESSAIISEM